MNMEFFILFNPFQISHVQKCQQWEINFKEILKIMIFSPSGKLPVGQIMAFTSLSISVFVSFVPNDTKVQFLSLCYCFQIWSSRALSCMTIVMLAKANETGCWISELKLKSEEQTLL